MTIAAPEKTGDLPLKGGKDAEKQKGLVKGTVIADKPDPLVVERAKEHAENLDSLDRFKKKANESGQTLLQAFKKSKRKRFVKIITDFGTHIFEADEQYKLKHLKEKTVQ